MSKKSIISLIACVAIIVISMLMPEVGGLSHAGIATIGLTLGMIVLLIAEALPVGLIAFLLVILQPILGLTDSLAESAGYFATPIFFFLLAAFGMATAMMKVPLTKRILKFLLLRFGKSTKGAITALMITTALLSTIIANLPALVLCYGIALDFLNIFEDEQQRKQTGKSLCIGLVMASMVGGICTPVGNMPMMMGATALADAGYPVSFIQWMIIGVPIAIILFVIMWFLLFKIHKPVEISEEKRNAFIQNIELPEKLTYSEKWVIVIFIAMIICWLLNAKFPVLDTMLVSVAGLCLLLFPGFKIMSWEDYSKGIGWPATLLTAAFVSICSVMTRNGVTKWILNTFLNVLPEGAGPAFVIIVLGIFLMISLQILPNGPALVSIFSVPMVGVATALGMSPVLLVMPLAFYSTYSFVLPIDSISLVTYASGNYKMTDMAKVGLPVWIIAIAVMAVLMPLIGGFIGVA